MNLNLLLFSTPEQSNVPANNLRECSPMTLTVQQMAKVLNISRNVAYDLTREPGFPCFRLGKKILINRELLQEWLNCQCKTVA
ncbi:MAG: helix-turn-helix domain-containing protein [Aristaeellaceae bacterium]